MTAAAPNRDTSLGKRPLMRSLLITSVFIAPALVMRFGGLHPNPIVSLVAYGAAVVAASFLLAWAAEAAQIDVSGGLAIAVLALIAVLPEYAVDLYYAYTSGHDPDYVQFAAANMTGSNRLLMGLGWPVVVLIAVAVATKATGTTVRRLTLEQSNRVELGFLLIAGMAAFLIPATGRIYLIFGVALLAWFGFYLYKLTRGDVEEPDLIGAAAAIGAPPAADAAHHGGDDVRRRGGGDPAVRRTLRQQSHRRGHPVGHRPVPAGAVAGAPGLGGPGVHHRDHLRRPRQGHQRHRHPDLVQGQPVDSAGRVPPVGATWPAAVAPRWSSTNARSRRCCSPRRRP